MRQTELRTVRATAVRSASERNRRKKRLAIERTNAKEGDKGDKMEYRENRDARRPFLSTPDSRVYFPAAAIEEARRSTARCLRRNEGVALVVGATGTGKTLLTRVLAAEFEAESLVAVVSPTRRIDAKSFWQQFLFGLRQTFCGCDETELRLMALDYLERSQRRRCVLLIDDAQNLPFRVFDELRSFVDQGAAAASQICVALFGTSSLEERLNLPPLYPFQQRIVSRSYLDAFENAEIADYIDYETRRVAGKFVFTPDAKRKVADFCKGSPRVANQLCDRALFLTAQESGKVADFKEKSGFDGDLETLGRIATESVEIRAIDATLVERAWANLLNLPEETPRLKTGDLGDVVEFGTLEDDEEDDAGFNDFAASEKSENDGNSEDGEDGESRVVIDVKDERDETNDNDVWESSDNDETDALDEELSEEENGGEVDAALEARLLRHLKIWEGAKEGADEENAVGDEAAEAAETDRGDRWERVDAFKERRDADGWKERAAVADDAALREENDASASNDWESVGEINESREINESCEIAENDVRNPEERVFDALKSEYFNEGFLFEVDGKEGKEARERGKRSRTRAKSTAKTRRPIVGDDDGSRLWNEANRRDDERFLETQLTAERVANRAVSDKEDEAAASDDEAEFISLEDRAYEQIVEDCWETTGNFTASDEYLSELSLLEQEIEEEANLIRRIRNIHLKLRSIRGAAERRRRNAVGETTANEEETANADVQLEDETLNY